MALGQNDPAVAKNRHGRIAEAVKKRSDRIVEALIVFQALSMPPREQRLNDVPDRMVDGGRYGIILGIQRVTAVQGDRSLCQSEERPAVEAFVDSLRDRFKPTADRMRQSFERVIWSSRDELAQVLEGLRGQRLGGPSLQGLTPPLREPLAIPCELAQDICRGLKVGLAALLPIVPLQTAEALRIIPQPCR